jgi:hypothetical protein
VKPRSVYRDVYLSTDQPMTSVVRAEAAWLWSGRDATLGGLSAAAMLGTKWIDAEQAADLFRVGDPVDGINIHRDRLSAEEVGSSSLEYGTRCEPPDGLGATR